MKFLIDTATLLFRKSYYSGPSQNRLAVPPRMGFIVSKWTRDIQRLTTMDEAAEASSIGAGTVALFTVYIFRWMAEILSNCLNYLEAILPTMTR